MASIGDMRRFSRSHLVHNIAALYAVHGARYLLPVIVIPYLARVLTPSGWGRVAFGQGFAAYLTLVIEYGFNLSATREVARSRNDHEKIAEILAGVIGAKFLLAALCLVMSWGAVRWVPVFREDTALLWAATFAAVALAFSPLWLFQGLEQMRVFATLDIAGKSLAAAGIFFLVHFPSDGWRVLALQGAGGLVAAAGGLAIAYRWFPAVIPTRANVQKSLRMGWTMFIFRSSVSLYTVGNSFILGLFVAPQFVGYYAGAERVSRASVAVFDPISQALFPRVSYLVQHARSEARRIARYALLLMGTGGLLMSVGMLLAAPTLVRMVLGPGYLPSMPALRILSLLPLLIALSNVLGIQWMLPLGMDRALNTIILSAGVMNIVLAALLARRYAHLGMASAAVVAETFVTGVMFVWLWKNGVMPLSADTKAEIKADNVPVAARM